MSYHAHGIGLYQTWQDLAEAWGAWFFSSYDSRALDVSQLRRDLRYAATIAAMSYSDGDHRIEQAYLSLSDADLLAVARYWSAPDGEVDEDDRREIPKVS